MSHWYDVDGNPHHTVIGLNGKERPTTVRDARKHGWWPSVTTILSIPASGALDNYKQNELLKAAMQNPFSEDKDVEKWKKTVVTMAQEHSKQARERGGELHNALEKYYKTGEVDKKERGWIEPVIKFMEERFPDVDDWVAEEGLYCDLGFAGTVDLYSPKHKLVLDFKTKDQNDVKKMKAYENHHMQTAAYAVMVQEGNIIEYAYQWQRYNLFISTQKKGLLNLTESEDFEKDWGMFYKLLRYWQIKTGHTPKDYCDETYYGGN